MKARSELLSALKERIRAWELPQEAAAGRLGITRPRLNDLLQGKLAKFSLDATVNLVTADTPEASAEAWRHARRPRLKATALVVEELDGATFKALAASRIDARHDRLDAQMGTSPERGCYR